VRLLREGTVVAQAAVAARILDQRAERLAGKIVRRVVADHDLNAKRQRAARTTSMVWGWPILGDEEHVLLQLGAQLGDRDASLRRRPCLRPERGVVISRPVSSMIIV